MKKNNFIFGFLLLVGVLFLPILVSADGRNITSAVNFTSPIVRAYNGTIVLNVTNNSATFMNFSNCTFYAKSSLTANNTWSTIGLMGVFNISAGTITYCVNGSFLSNSLQDANNYQFNATCRNASNDNGFANAITSVIIDNQNPVTPSLTTHTQDQTITTSGTQTFTATVSDPTTTSCTYVIARGGATSGEDYITNVASYSATTCSFTKTFSTTADNGIWWAYLIASDESNTTSQSPIRVNIQLASAGSGQIVYSTATQPIYKKPGFIIFLITIIAVIGLIVWAVKRS